MLQQISSGDEPIGTKFLSLNSPDYSVEYPAIEHRELIPADLLRLLDSIWNTGQFTARKIEFLRLRDVFVAFEGLVFNKDLSIYQASITDHLPEEIETARRTIRERMADGSMPVHLGPAVLCKKRGTHNYGHFLIEMLPKAYLARRHLSGENLAYVIGAEGGGLGAVMRDALAMLDIPESAIMRRDRQPSFFRELIVINGLTQHSRFMSPLVFECLGQLAGRVAAAEGERLYVSRGSALFRKLLNEDELTPILTERGYEIVDPGRLSLAEQIAKFKGARSIIGITGAGLTNVVFSRPGATMTCLTPATMPETFFWFLATLKNHRFLDVRLPEQGGEPPGYPRSAGNIRIEPEALLRLLAGIEQRTAPNWPRSGPSVAGRQPGSGQ